MEFTLPTINYAARENHQGSNYFFENATRGGARVWVIQRTEFGRAFFRDRDGYHEVPETYAMLFCHGENSSYGCIPEDPRPYGNAFLSLLGSGFQDWFTWIVMNHGPVVPLPEKFSAHGLFQEAVDHRIHQAFRDRFQEAEILYRFFLTWLRDLSQSQSGRDPAQLLHERLRNEFHRPFSLKEFARSRQVSREHLTRQFSRKYGIPPATLLRETRMNQARTLLGTTSLSISQVGMQCGYPDPNGFSRTFRRTFGVSPEKFRAELQPNP